MEEPIIDLQDLDYNNLIFDHPVKKNNIYLTYIYIKRKNGKIVPIIKVPYMKMLETKGDKYIYLEFNPDNNNDYSLYNFISNFDNNIIKLITRKSKTWFGKTMPLNVVDEFYKSTIKTIKDNNLPRLKIKIKNNEYLNNNYFNKDVIPYFKFKYLKFLSNESYLELELYKLELLNNNIVKNEESCNNEDIIYNNNIVKNEESSNNEESFNNNEESCNSEEIIYNNIEVITNEINEKKEEIKVLEKNKNNREYYDKKIEKYTNHIIILSNKISKYRNLLLEKNIEDTDSD
jgi:hypothetical protein